MGVGKRSDGFTGMKLCSKYLQWNGHSPSFRNVEAGIWAGGGKSAVYRPAVPTACLATLEVHCA